MEFRSFSASPEWRARLIEALGLDEVNVRQCGAHPTYSSEANQAAFQLALDRIATGGKMACLVIPESGDGEYKIAGPLDGSGITSGFYIKGAGREASIIKPDSFGRSEWLFNLSAGGKSSKIAAYGMGSGFQILGNDNIDDPGGIYLPWQTSLRWWDLKIKSLGNIGYWIEEADNVLIDIDCISCGRQPLLKEFGTAVYAGTSGTTLTAYSDTAGTPLLGAFTSMQGADVFVSNGDTCLGATDTNACWARRVIQSVGGDGSTCTVDAAFGRTVSASAGNLISFGRLRGSASGATLTLSQDVLSSADEDCLAILPGAGTAGGVHISKMLDVSGTTVTLETAAITATTNQEVWLAPSGLIGHQAKNLVAASDFTNDIGIRTRTENYKGPGLVLCNFINYELYGKIHGLPVTTRDFARTGPNLVMSRATNGEDHLGFEKSYTAGHPSDDTYNSAPVQVFGSKIRHQCLSWFSTMPDNQYAIDVSGLTDTATEIGWGPRRYAIGTKHYPIKLGSTLTPYNVRERGSATSSANLSATKANINGAAQAFDFFGLTKSLPNMATDADLHYTPLNTKGGLFYVGSTTAAYQWFGVVATGVGGTTVAIDGSPLKAGADIVVAAAGKAKADVVRADGTSAKVSLLFTTDGWLVYVNRTGATANITISWYGGGR